jgi:programmed cell death 6-interacting protein
MMSLQASESDKSIVQRLQECDSTLEGLSIDTAAGAMPRLQAPLVNMSGEDPAVVVANLRRGLEMLTQLAGDRLCGLAWCMA